MIKKIRSSIIMQLICIVFVVLIVLTGTLYASYLYVKRTTVSYAETLSDSLLKQADTALSLYKENMRYSAESLCHYLVKDSLESGVAEMDAVSEALASSYFSQLSVKNREIVSAVIFDNDMNMVVSMGKEVELPEKQLYLRQEEDLNADWYFPDEEDFYYAFYYPIYSEGSIREQIGMCVILLEHWRIDGTLHNILNDSVSAMLLSDSNNLDLSYHTFGNVPAVGSMSELRSNKDFVYREGNWQNGIRIAVAVSISGNTSGSGGIRKMIMVAAILTSLLLTIIILFSYTQLARPIHELDRFIDNSIGHPESRLNMNRTDEIGKVASSLDHMLDENQRMIEEIKDSKIRLYETELAQQKMEILAYRNQINPHFLYNTLSCMRDMALIKDEDSIAEMAMALSDIFRYAVKGSNIVTVGDEVSYIKKYARIIEYRFMGKIMIETNVADEVMDKPIIRFFLQPLVENSVFHGLEGKMEAGNVDVTVEAVEDRLELTVTDNGCGMDEDTLEALRDIIENPRENSGIGISNIVQRLRLFYGDDYTMSVDSEIDRGTVIHISVPDHIREI
ncbi:MAG: sensor histidine kinase [Eubacterium sp.]|nr:sensor histidine kinase [Eubacterium sp.]